MNGHPGQFSADPHAVGKAFRFTRLLVSGDTTAARNTEFPRNAWDLENAAGPWHVVVARWYRELAEPREAVLAALEHEVGAGKVSELLRVTEDLVLAFPKVLKKTERDTELDAAVAIVRDGANEPNLESRAVEAQHLRDHATVAACARRLVQCHPAVAKYHLWLGAALGRSGDLEGGISECRVAGQLDESGGLLAAAEVGILLLDAHRAREAVEEFEALAPRTQAEGDPVLAVHVLYHHAEALLRVGRTADALPMLRRARQLDPRHAPSAERLAHALLLSGAHKEGVAMAKEAAHLGRRDVLDAFEAGEYRRP